MTRKEAMMKAFKESIIIGTGGSSDNLSLLIDDIYDDFESRACGSCKHLKEGYKGFSYGCERLQLLVSKEWNCGDWEAKDE